MDEVTKWSARAAVGWVMYGGGLWIGGWVRHLRVRGDPLNATRWICGVSRNERSLDTSAVVLQLSGIAVAIFGTVCAFTVPQGPPYQLATLVLCFGALLPSLAIFVANAVWPMRK